jgi:hypothetical protein
MIGVALVDTGASISGIDTSVIQQLAVQPVGQVRTKDRVVWGRAGQNST